MAIFIYILYICEKYETWVHHYSALAIKGNLSEREHWFKIPGYSLINELIKI